ncbi:hypothetical protein KBD20_02960 [Candidatus Saccharibacteria bacterium]|nr:hypothetical protein [Candidatus Saccharibacteria bacterium]
METDTVFDRFMSRDRATRLEYISWAFGGVALTLLVIGLVSQRTGQDPTLNVVNWGTPWMIAWGIGTTLTVATTGICQFMRWEHLNPKPGVRPWYWYELASAAAVLSVAIIVIIALNAKLLLKM